MYVDPHLPRHIFGWYSPHLGLEMPIVSYGDRGHPLLLYPSAQGDFLENERSSLIKSIEHLLLAGKVRVFSIDSINRFAWLNRRVPTAEAARRQVLYSAYVEEEVVPHIRRVVSDPFARVAVTGASFGAFHAANQFFRRPDLFDTLIGMSGFYDLQPEFTGAYWSNDVYFNNPASFVPNMNDEHTLRLLRGACEIHLVTGQGSDEAPHLSRRLSELLHDKGIPHNLDLWGADVEHSVPWWSKMLPFYLAEKVHW